MNNHVFSGPNVLMAGSKSVGDGSGDTNRGAGREGALIWDKQVSGLWFRRLKTSAASMEIFV